MNRKLQHTLIALAASVALFAVLLLAGAPTLEKAPEPAHMTQVSTDLGEVDAIDAAAMDASDISSNPGAAATHRQSRRARALLALPYFSFAQGLRHNRS